MVRIRLFDLNMRLLRWSWLLFMMVYHSRLITTRCCTTAYSRWLLDLWSLNLWVYYRKVVPKQVLVSKHMSRSMPSFQELELLPQLLAFICILNSDSSCQQVPERRIPFKAERRHVSIASLEIILVSLPPLPHFNVLLSFPTTVIDLDQTAICTFSI